MKAWGGERLRDDKRWKFGVLPVRNGDLDLPSWTRFLSPVAASRIVLWNVR